MPYSTPQSDFSLMRFRYKFILALAVFFFAVNALFRLSLHFFFPSVLPFSFSLVPNLAAGAANDFFTLFFILILPFFFVFLPSDGFLKSFVGKIYLFLILLIYTCLLIFNAFAEYFFFEEFSSRFNFIAVDYLIYTNEVIQNIVESYPLFWLLTAVFLLAVASSLALWRFLAKTRQLAGRKSSFFSRIAQILLFYIMAAGSYFVFSPIDSSENRYWNEYAKNGIYELFSAYLHNQLDYRKFYKTIDTKLAFDIVQKDLAENTSSPITENNYRRISPANAQEQKPNVIVVIIESLGQNKYVENRPFLNSLAEKSLAFTNMKSTGTRTVRGLEAIMLSIPPTPGNSIVRRADNHDLYNFSSPFKDRGYNLDFIYGGIGFFDNMNDFFEGIGFNITDKLSFTPENKTFSNAWGQCDGDSFAESLRLADASFAEKKPFMQVILTTSNHRPFTFPENTVDAPQGIRESAIEYTDYAIKEFLRSAEDKPWFDDTVFVFVGDHPSSIAGKTEVPYQAYGVVSMIYSPKYVMPQKINTLCSQIDIAPTLLNLIGFDYTSSFFGKNVLEMPEDQGRAFVSTYQLLGYVDKDYFIVLNPEAKYELTALNDTAAQDKKKEQDFVNKAIAYYQVAYDLFTQKQLKTEKIQAVK